MKKDSKKKDSKKKKKKKEKQSKELALLKELSGTMQSMADELEAIKASNKSLKKELKKLQKKKKKEKEPEVITSVMEPQVLPPEKTKVRRTRKTSTAKSKTTAAPKSAAPSEAKAKPGPKPARRGRKPGPKPGTRRRAAKPATPGRPAGPEDLKFIQGLGAKIETLLNEQGVKTFNDLAKASQASVKGVLENAGPRFKNQDPKPLIEQAKLVKGEKWTELESLQAELMKGKKKPGPKAVK